MKKILALTLAMIMVVGFVPQIAFASTPRPTIPPRHQRAVADPNVAVTSIAGDNYTLNISWERPILSTITDARSAAVSIPGDGNIPQLTEDPILPYAPAGWWSLHPIRYELDFRSGTRNEQFGATLPPHIVSSGLSQELAPIDGPGATGGAGVRSQGTNATITRAMQNNSLYEIRIVPIKYNPYRITIPSTIPLVPPTFQIGWQRAPDDPALPAGPNILVITDIVIDNAEGREGAITIEWQNPTFNGQNVFSHWEIAYSSAIGAPNIGDSNRRAVPYTQMEVLPGNRLRYTIDDPRISALEMYNVRILPMVSATQTIRATPTMQIGDQLFRVATRSEGEFQLERPVLITPELRWERIGADYLRIFWSRLGDTGGAIERVHVEQWPAGTTDEDVNDPYARPEAVIGFIQGSEFVGGVNEWFYGPGVPRVPMAFVLAIYINGVATRTNVINFDPTHVDFTPYRPDIVSVVAEAVRPGVGTLHSLQWLSFARVAYTLEEAAELTQPPHSLFQGRFIDTALFYEIKIADSWETLINLNNPIETWAPSGHMPEPWFMREWAAPYNYDPTWLMPGFLNEFYTMESGALERVPLRDNATYYIRIRAVRNSGETSQWSSTIVFIPPYAGVPARPEMIASPPVEIVGAGETSLPIRWPIRYLEMLQHRTVAGQRPGDEQWHMWHSVVGVDPRNQNLIFGRSAAHIENILEENNVSPASVAGRPFAVLNDMLDETPRANLLGHGPLPLNMANPADVGHFLRNVALAEHILPFLTGLGADMTTSPAALRIQDLTGRGYDIHVVEYSHMMSVGRTNAEDGESPFDGYLRTRALWSWTSITEDIAISNGLVNFAVNYSHAPVPGPLQPNSAYVVFIRPYQVFPDGSRIHAFYPSFVIGNTTTQIVTPTPDPTTPVLHPVHEFVTDHSIGVRWRVQSDMGFVLRIAERMADHPNGGEILAPPLLTGENIQAALDNPDIPLEIRNVTVQGEEIPYYFLRIDGLFPDTTYYVWARAAGLNVEGEVNTDLSQPSNPVDMRTSDITPPRPPALATAPTSLLNVYNRLNDTNHSADEPDALNIMLTRIFADYETGTERAESGTAEGGEATPINLPQDLYRRLYIIKFSDLTANTRHYVRARTILTVERRPDDNLRTYTYEIQVADNEDFFDAITFNIPTLPAVDLTGNNARRAMSDWVYMEVDTGRDDGEFDGVHRPEQFPLPDRDWEITYDAPTQTLRFRFRTNRIGADGRPDQNVDQRFIHRLINERTFTYEIDISEFEDMPISNRIVEIPVSIIRAFDERRITLQINTGDLIYSIPPGAFNTAAVRDLQQGVHGFFEINMTTNPRNMPELVPNTIYAIPPQRLTVNAQTADRRINLDTFARPLEISLPIEGHITPIGMNTGLFYSGANILGWQDMNGQFSFGTNTLTAQMQRPATFAGITRTTPETQAPQDPSNQAMQRVTSRLTITDMQTFNPNHQVTTNEFNNVVNAIVNNRTTVALGANLSAADTRSLTNARLLAPENLTRENAIDIMVRLYENRTRQVLTPMTPAASVPGIQNAAPATHRNMRIAADIGFITGPLEPQGRLTMGELMNMVDIILQDM